MDLNYNHKSHIHFLIQQVPLLELLYFPTTKLGIGYQADELLDPDIDIHTQVSRYFVTALLKNLAPSQLTLIFFSATAAVSKPQCHLQLFSSCPVIALSLALFLTCSLLTSISSFYILPYRQVLSSHSQSAITFMLFSSHLVSFIQPTTQSTHCKITRGSSHFSVFHYPAGKV